MLIAGTRVVQAEPAADDKQTETAAEDKGITCDGRLIGRWCEVNNADHPAALISSKDGGKTLQVVGIEGSEKETESPPIIFTTHRIGSQWYMIVNWPIDEQKTTTMLVAYDIRADGTLEIRLADDERIAAAIKAGELMEVSSRAVGTFSHSIGSLCRTKPET